MYEYPVRLIQEQFLTHLKETQEDGIYTALQGYGVYVDKEELIKALNYDRQQYEKGYVDGMKEFAERLKENLDISATGYSTEEVIEQVEDEIDRVLYKMESKSK